MLSGYTFLGRPIDVVETSRGCTFDCSFCSIIEMRGRNFHTFDFTRVLADIADARARGARAIFLVDDNITLNVARFEALCRAIIEAGFNDIHYIVQAMTSSIASHGAALGAADAPRRLPLRVSRNRERARRGSRVPARLGQERAARRAAAASATPRIARHRRAAPARASSVVGGIIVGNPDDTPASIEANLAFARRYVDWPYIQHPTPYPGHADDRAISGARDLIVNERVEEYDGTTAVVRTGHLEAEEIEFLRWRAERWMKVRHLPTRPAPLPAVRAAARAEMCAHTFRGSSVAIGGRSGERAGGVRAATRRGARPSASICRRLSLRAIRRSSRSRFWYNSRSGRAFAYPGSCACPRLAGVAQLVEQLIRNQQVVRSIRIAGSILISLQKQHFAPHSPR